MAIVDAYVDEPSLLGVPPYVSPYPRLLAGAASDAGHDWMYVTADELRASGVVRGAATLPAPGAHERAVRKAHLLPECELLVVTGGATVPGKYLRGLPLSTRELGELARSFRGTKLLGGPLARFCVSETDELARLFDFVARGDAEVALNAFLKRGRWSDRQRTLEEEARWSVAGAALVREHPDFPRPLMVELSLYRGCVRYFTGGCRFCTEVLYGEPAFRRPEDIAAEVAALHAAGAVNFRLGGASCAISYMADGVGSTPTPRPSPEAIRALLSGIRAAAPGLEVLHTDNADPAVLASHPEEARASLEAMVAHCTGGNVLSLGLESADPAVAEANNLNATPEQALEAVRLINEAGSERSPTGLPRLLPGLNFLCGLEAETPASYELGIGFLKRVLAEGLLLRRINIRRVLPLRRAFPPLRHRGAFLRFKERVRREIDTPMLLRVAPPGTVLREVFPELTLGRLTFGRQAGTYPILVGIPAASAAARGGSAGYKAAAPGGAPLDVVVVDHGERSVTGLPAPLRLNRLPPSALAAIAGVGRRRAARLVRARPFRSFDEAAAALDDSGALAPYKELMAFD